jgi:uncharacterized membrane protein
MATTEPSANGHVPPAVQSFLHTLEHDDRTDQVAELVKPVAERLNAGPQGSLLRGDHIGHALHPLLTDLPLGCWTAATILDLVGGRRSAPAAQRLIGIGLLLVPPTAASGMVDWQEDADDPRIRRVGLIHAGANVVAASLYFASWNARRSGNRLRGIALALMGGVVASLSGYLGGHLSFARGAGQGARGLDDTATGPGQVPQEVRDQVVPESFDAAVTAGGPG